MRTTVAFALTLAAFGAAASPAFTGDPVVAFGLSDPEALGGFVNAVDGSEDDQIARWRRPVCPLVIGMRGDLNHYVGETIRSLGGEVGADPAPAGCEPNLVVAVVRDPAAFIGEMHDEWPRALADVPVPDRRALTEIDAPVRAWSVSEIHGADGRLVQNITYKHRTTVSAGVSMVTGVTPSFIQRATRIDIAARVIVIDLDSVEAMTMRQLSGYAGMLAYGAFETDRAIAPGHTILNLFHDTASAPADITDWDVAYLRGLYTDRGARDASAQRAHIVRSMHEELESAGR